MEHQHPRTSPTRLIVLIIGGHDESRALYALALSATGFDVVSACDCSEAYRRAVETHPDVIVTDLTTPDFDGRQFVQDLTENPGTRGIPVVAFTPCLPDELAAGLRRVLSGAPHDGRAH